MICNKSFVSLLLIFVVAVSYAVQPDSLEVERKVYDLEGVTIRASASTNTLGYSLTREIDPERGKGVINISDLLEDIPGLQLTTSGKGVSDLRIRGFIRKQIRVMINGRPLNGGYFGNVDLHSLPVTDIERINIIKGPVAAHYGANTMGGAIDIITNEMPPGWQNISRFSIDSNESKNLSYITSLGLRDHSFRIHLERSLSPGYYLPAEFEPTLFEDGERRNRSAFSRYSGGLSWQGYLFSVHNLDFQTNYVYMDNKEIPSLVYEANFRRYTGWHNYNTSLRYRVPVVYNLNSDLMFYYDHNADTYEEYTDSGFQTPSLISDLQSSLYGVKWDTRWLPSDRLVFQQGYIYELNDFKRKDNAFYTEWYSGSTVLNQIYSQPEFQIKQNLTLTSGVALSSFHIDNIRYNLDLSTGLFYHFPNNIRTSIAYSRNNRYPLLQELYSRNEGNPELLPERADKYEATLGIPFTVKNSPGYAHLALFRNVIFDLIEPQYDTEEGTRLYRNVEKADNYGSDLNITFDILHRWVTDLSYSLMLSDTKSDYSMLRIPRHSLVLASRFKISGSFSLSQNSEFYSERNDLDDSDNQKVLESYDLHSMSLTYLKGRVTLSCGVENLFDSLYYERYGFPGRGRSFFFSAELRV